MENDNILNSWRINASEWKRIIENGKIESRRITNPAIFETIIKYKPAKVLDLGCGEGWLTRELNRVGIKTIGVDGTKELIASASEASITNKFYTQSYEQIIAGDPIQEVPYEAVVFNFCLYHKEETEHLLKLIQHHMFGRKLVFIQTLHPNLEEDGFVYKNQWINDSWKGLKGAFKSPHRWYYRTLEGWTKTFVSAGLYLKEVREPMARNAIKPSSIIFILVPAYKMATHSSS